MKLVSVNKDRKTVKLYSFESFKVYEYDEDRMYNGHEDGFGTSKRSETLFLFLLNFSIIDILY